MKGRGRDVTGNEGRELEVTRSERFVCLRCASKRIPSIWAQNVDGVLSSPPTHSPTQIIEDCNSEVGRMRHMEELIHMASKIEFDKLKVRCTSSSLLRHPAV